MAQVKLLSIKEGGVISPPSAHRRALPLMMPTLSQRGGGFCILESGGRLKFKEGLI